jgi:hypothetical protein
MAKNMTIYFPSTHLIKHVLNGDDTALLGALSGQGYQELNFAHKKLEGKNAITIVKALRNFKIASINFSANYLSSPYLSEFMKYVSEINATRLNLAYNHIGPEGAMNIIDGLGICHIKNLNISHNYLGQEGKAAILQSCLAKNIEVDLSHNIGNKFS